MEQPQRTLTQADIQAIAEAMKSHACRFDNVSREEMDFLKDLLNIYKETRSEVIKWMVKAAIYGMLIVIMGALWFKYGVHK